MAISVYFYPTTLQFFADDSNSHRQIITIYNPLEFGVKFKGSLFDEEFFPSLPKIPY